MLKLDHLTVISSTLIDGISHVRKCLSHDVPFGTRHDNIGMHNHRQFKSYESTSDPSRMLSWVLEFLRCIETEKEA